MTEEQVKAARLFVSGKVRALLARHGTSDPQQQLATLMTLMNASHSQVYRKLSGRSSWLEEDLQRIAEHHGETLGTLFRDDADPARPPSGAAASSGSSSREGHWHAARIDVAGRLLDCRVMLATADTRSEVDGKAAPGRMVLLNLPQGAQVAWDTGDHGGKVQGTVRLIEVDFDAPQHGGFAIFDDDPDVADAIVDNLLARGLSAQAFYATRDLRATPQRFDTYIIDWFSSDTSTAADLVEHLRMHHAPEATIVVLTGQIQRGGAESQLAQLIHTHDVIVELKPMRVDLLLAKIAHQRQHQG